MSKSIFIMIGNSDDKLPQSEWALFYAKAAQRIDSYALEIHGSWVSKTVDQWQNACWCIVPFSDDDAAALKRRMAELAHEFRQDSIAWAEATTEFITPKES